MKWPIALIATTLAGASIEGTVVDRVTGSSVRNAVVFAGSARTMTDAAGAFHLDGLKPGRYAIEVRHVEYPSETRPVRDIVLAEGDNRTGVRLALTPPGAISGRITDTEGEPLADCSLRMLRYNLFQGELALTQRYFGRTDEEGRYRIHSVHPGRYFLSPACPATRKPAHGLMTAEQIRLLPRTGFERIYWGGSKIAAGASELLVRPGMELENTDFQLKTVEVQTVTGTVVGGDGSGNASVLLRPVDSADFAGEIHGGAARGRFLLAGVPAGTYELIAQARTASGVFAGKTRVEVPAAEPARVELSPGFDLPVSFRFERTAADPKILAVGISTPGIQMQAGKLADGTFVLHGLTPGVWSLRVLADSVDVYVKSVRAGQQEFRPERIDLASLSAGSLEVVLAGGAGKMTGTLIPESAEKSSHVRMIAVTAWGAILSNPIVLESKVEWRGLEPGRYRVLAARVADLSALASPSVLKQLSGYLQAVTVEEGAGAVVDVKVVPEEVLERLGIY